LVCWGNQERTWWNLAQNEVSEITQPDPLTHEGRHVLARKYIRQKVAGKGASEVSEKL
jgi:hypothetical protein